MKWVANLKKTYSCVFIDYDPFFTKVNVIYILKLIVDEFEFFFTNKTSTISFL